MEEGAEGEGSYSEHSEGEVDPDDVAVGVPVQASTIGGVDPNLHAPTDTLLHLTAPTYSNQQATPSVRASSNQQHAPSAEVQK